MIWWLRLSYYKTWEIVFSKITTEIFFVLCASQNLITAPQEEKAVSDPWIWAALWILQSTGEHYFMWFLRPGYKKHTASGSLPFCPDPQNPTTVRWGCSGHRDQQLSQLKSHLQPASTTRHVHQWLLTHFHPPPLSLPTEVSDLLRQDLKEHRKMNFNWWLTIQY